MTKIQSYWLHPTQASFERTSFLEPFSTARALRSLGRRWAWAFPALVAARWILPTPHLHFECSHFVRLNGCPHLPTFTWIKRLCQKALMKEKGPIQPKNAKKKTLQVKHLSCWQNPTNNFLFLRGTGNRPYLDRFRPSTPAG